MYPALAWRDTSDASVSRQTVDACAMSTAAIDSSGAFRPTLTVLAITMLASVAGCGASTEQFDDQGRPIVTNDAAAKAARDLEAAIAKDRAAGGRLSVPSAASDRAGGGGSNSPPPLASRGPSAEVITPLPQPPGAAPVIIRDPSPATSPSAMLAGAQLASAAASAPVAPTAFAPAASAPASATAFTPAAAPFTPAAPPLTPAAPPAAVNAPLELERDRPVASGSSRGQTSADLAARRESALRGYLREVAQILDNDVSAASGSLAEPGGAAGGRKLVSSSVLLAALSPIDPSIADRYANIRVRLDEDQRNVTDVVRQLSETAAGRSILPDGTVRSLEADKPSTVSQADTTVSVLSRVLSDGAAKVKQATGLTIPTVALVSAVESYGRYTPMPSNRFIAGRSTPVLVYTELANFSNTATEESNRSEGEFGVSIQQHIKLIPALGDVIASDFGPQDFISRARSSRRDLFLARRIDLPANLTIGRYVLNIHIKDLATGHTEEAKIQLEVVAK